MASSAVFQPSGLSGSISPTKCVSKTLLGLVPGLCFPGLASHQVLLLVRDPEWEPPIRRKHPVASLTHSFTAWPVSTCTLFPLLLTSTCQFQWELCAPSYLSLWVTGPHPLYFLWLLVQHCLQLCPSLLVGSFEFLFWNLFYPPWNSSRGTSAASAPASAPHSFLPGLPYPGWYLNTTQMACISAITRNYEHSSGGTILFMCHMV